MNATVSETQVPHELGNLSSTRTLRSAQRHRGVPALVSAPDEGASRSDGASGTDWPQSKAGDAWVGKGLPDAGAGADTAAPGESPQLGKREALLLRLY